MTLKGLELATQEEKDAVRHLCDAVNLHVDAQGSDAYGKYVAIRLSDGKSPDNALYDTRRDAVRHNIHDPWCFYVKIRPGGIQPREAWVVLGYARQAKENGAVFQNEEPIVPMLTELAAPWLGRQMACAPGGTFSRG
jgi:hypothetical protein